MVGCILNDYIKRVVMVASSDYHNTQLKGSYSTRRNLMVASKSCHQLSLKPNTSIMVNKKQVVSFLIRPYDLNQVVQET